MVNSCQFVSIIYLFYILLAKGLFQIFVYNYNSKTYVYILTVSKVKLMVDGFLLILWKKQTCWLRWKINSFC